MDISTLMPRSRQWTFWKESSPSFDVTYVHGPDDEHDRKIQGTFLIKSFELDFNYHYWKALPDSSGTTTGTGTVTAPGSGSGSGQTTPTRVPKWTFDASLGLTSPTGGDVGFVAFIEELIPGGNSTGVIDLLNEIPLQDITVATETPSSSDSPIIFGITMTTCPRP
jgi:hypothetical protein